MTSTATRRVDCDVHCALPNAAALHPHLPRQWSEFMQNTEFRAPGSVGTTYPAWSDAVATNGGELTLERLQDKILGDSELALLHCYYGVESFTHPYFGSAVASAVNRWIAAEWLARDERLLASLVVTPQHVPQAVAEIERAASERRFVEVLVPARSPSPYGNPRFWPIWEAAAAHGLAVGITYGGGTGTPPTPVGWLSSYWEEYVVATLTFESHVASLAVSGIFNRCPNLQVVVHESGWSWLPGMMWRLDQEWRAFRREVPWVGGPPSSVIRRHFRFTTGPSDAPPTADQLRRVVDQLGTSSLLMYGSDYPHRDGSAVDLLLEVLDADEAARMLWQNAYECYGLDDRLDG